MNVDVSVQTGLPLVLSADGRLQFGAGLEAIAPAVRNLAEMTDVLQDPAADGPEQLYFMYRNVARPGDRPRLASAGLRYDVTVMRPGLIGREYVKTVGHYHPLAEAAQVTYPEIYEVASGQALFLLQRAEPPYREVTDAVAVLAGPGERLLVPPGYGHITVNPGPDWLVLTNIVEATFGSVYEPMRALRGGAYYAVTGQGGVQFERNARYGAVAPLRERTAPHWPDLGIIPGEPLYTAVVRDPERFAYVVRPDLLPAELL